MITFDFTNIHGSGWFPGHMLKAIRQVKEKTKMVDLVVLMTDARVPDTSLNQDIYETIQDKPILVLLNKCDLAEDELTRYWQQQFSERNINSLRIQAQSKRGLKQIAPKALEIIKEDRQKKGCTRPLLRPKRLMIVGVPNIGKSTLINALSRSAKAKTGPSPGVTKSQQWVKIDKDLELLDTPGIMPPGNPGPESELKLGLSNIIKQANTGEDFLALYLLYRLLECGRKRSEMIRELAGGLDFESGEELLSAIALKSNWLLQGGTPDLHKTSCWLLNQFNKGRFGALTLDRKIDSQPKEKTARAIWNHRG